MQTSTLLIPIMRTVTEDFTEAEQVAVNEAVQTGRDPQSTGSYSKISDLFTENGGSRMYHETRSALAAVTLARLTQPGWRGVDPPDRSNFRLMTLHLFDEYDVRISLTASLIDR